MYICTKYSFKISFTVRQGDGAYPWVRWPQEVLGVRCIHCVRARPRYQGDRPLQGVREDQTVLVGHLDHGHLGKKSETVLQLNSVTEVL